MNDFVMNITKSERSVSKELPRIKVYQTESGEYVSRDVTILINAISLLSKSPNESVSLAVEMLSVSERTRRTQ